MYCLQVVTVFITFTFVNGVKGIEYSSAKHYAPTIFFNNVATTILILCFVFCLFYEIRKSYNKESVLQRPTRVDNDEAHDATLAHRAIIIIIII